MQLRLPHVLLDAACVSSRENATEDRPLRCPKCRRDQPEEMVNTLAAEATPEEDPPVIDVDIALAENEIAEVIAEVAAEVVEEQDAQPQEQADDVDAPPQEQADDGDAQPPKPPPAKKARGKAKGKASEASVPKEKASVKAKGKAAGGIAKYLVPAPPPAKAARASAAMQKHGAVQPPPKPYARCAKGKASPPSKAKANAATPAAAAPAPEGPTVEADTGFGRARNMLSRSLVCPQPAAPPPKAGSVSAFMQSSTGMCYDCGGEVAKGKCQNGLEEQTDMALQGLPSQNNSII